MHIKDYRRRPSRGRARLQRAAELAAIVAGVGFISLADDTSLTLQAVWLLALVALVALAVHLVVREP